jgi:hypothetical protein
MALEWLSRRIGQKRSISAVAPSTSSSMNGRTKISVRRWKTSLSGKLGGVPFEILATTFSTVQPTQYVPFEFHLDGRNSSARVGGQIAFNLEPVKNPVTGEPEFVRIEHATGFVFKGAEVVSARDLRVSCGDINFQYGDKAGFVTEVHYQN